jgi:endonuclease G
MKGLIFLLLFISGNSHADCPNSDFIKKYTPKNYVGQNNPLSEYCYEQYVLHYNFDLKSAVWVGEHLYPKETFVNNRVNSFRENKAIPELNRTTLQDYIEPNFDRGHLAPSGDMTNPTSQRESFLLSNMIPQVMENNRGVWKRLEENLRDVSRKDELIIITGPVFEVPFTYIGNKVPVPKYLFKYVYNISKQQEFGYLIPNIKTHLDFTKYKVTKEVIEQKANIKF